MAAERAAILTGLPTGDRVTVAVVGVGPACAAARTARLLTLAEAAGEPYSIVLSVGIAGGFPGRAELGGLVLATRSVAADLGADSAGGFLALDELGFGATVATVDGPVHAALRAALPDAATGAVLTVSTVTGTTDRAATLAARHPDAVAEAMEGYGVACATTLCGAAFGELRAVSNVVGPREPSAWRVADALAALTTAAVALRAVL